MIHNLRKYINFYLHVSVALVVLMLTHSEAFANEKGSIKTVSRTQAHVLFILSSHEYGYWASELLEPYEILSDVGIAITLASPTGGKNPVGGLHSLNESTLAKFNSEALQTLLTDTTPLAEIEPTEFDAVYVVGGAGPMFDLIDDIHVKRTIKDVYEQGGIISADCHGPAALVNVRLSNGQLLVQNKMITAKANSEEGEWAREHYPFLLEDKFSQLGAKYIAGPSWQSHVVVDGQLITGQNPQSVREMTIALIKKLNETQEKRG